MLSKLNENHVVGAGFEIEITGPECMTYRFDAGEVKITMDYDPRERMVCIYASAVTELNEQTKAEMLEHIRLAVSVFTGDFRVV